METEVVRFNGFIYLLVFVVLEMEPRAMCMASNIKESTPGPPLKYSGGQSVGSHKMD